MAPVTMLALIEAVPLAHALVDRVARDHDVRVLFIKGPAARGAGPAGRPDLGRRRRARRSRAPGTSSPRRCRRWAGWTSTPTPPRPCCRCTRSPSATRSGPASSTSTTGSPASSPTRRPSSRRSGHVVRRSSVAGQEMPVPRPGRPCADPGPALAARPPRRLAPTELDDLEQRLADDLDDGRAPRPRRAGRRPRRRRHGRAVPRARSAPRRSGSGRLAAGRPAGLAPAHRTLRHHRRELGGRAAPPAAARLAPLPLVRRLALRPRAADGRPRAPRTTGRL